MFVEIFLGKQALITNNFGEKEKGIEYSADSFLAEEKSVKRAEFYQAMSTGLNVEKVVSMNIYEYYSFVQDAQRKYAKIYNEHIGKIVEYTIVREYHDGTDNIELTLKRGVENVSA